MPPLALSDEAMTMFFHLAEPLDPGVSSAFFEAVAAELGKEPAIGDGCVYRARIRDAASGNRCR